MEMADPAVFEVDLDAPGRRARKVAAAEDVWASRRAGTGRSQPVAASSCTTWVKLQSLATEPNIWSL